MRVGVPGVAIFVSFSIFTLKAAHFRNDEDFDILSDVITSVRCSKSKLSVSKADALYTWEVDGLLSYLRYLRDFGLKEFQHSSGNIVFDSDRINGEWGFELHSTGQENFVTVTYTYQENKDNMNGNFGINLKIIQPNFDSITFPIQKPTDISRETKFTNSNVKDKGSGSSFIFSYPSSEEDTDQEGINSVTLKFRWPAIPTAKILEFQYENTELIFVFMIHAYFPADVKTVRKSTCNLDNLESKYVRSETESILEISTSSSECKETNSFLLLRNSTAMFANPIFSDLIVRVENISIPVHSVILYHSSPQLATLVLNATKLLDVNDGDTESNSQNHSHPVIEISDDIGYNGTYEMLRYIYTGKVENLEKYAHRIIIGAEQYQLPGLKTICEQILISKANLSNVINLYVLGIDVSSSRLVRKAFAVIQANRANIVSQSEEFRKLSVKYPNLMFELFIT